MTLVSPIGDDKLSIDLHASGPADVTNGQATALDGEWTNATSVYPSGNGSAGGDFNFAFNVLPGDVNQDGIINVQDLALVSSGWLSAGPAGDVNADGIVNSQDLAFLSSNWLATLPQGSPNSASAQRRFRGTGCYHVEHGSMRTGARYCEPLGRRFVARCNYGGRTKRAQERGADY